MSKRYNELKRGSGVDLTEGTIAGGITKFCLPLFLGQLFQQLYNIADAWVIGNYAEDEAFAAVSSAGSIVFFVFGFFGGIAVGGGVVISRYFGANDREMVEKAIHTNFLFGIIASVLATVIGLLFVPVILRIMQTPDEVMPFSLMYLRILFGGISASVMYNICMSIMRSIGDSKSPLWFLIISSVANVFLDCLFVIVFRWGVAGAAAATVLSQTLSVVLCIVKMVRIDDYTGLDLKKIRLYGPIMREVVRLGIPTGIQNSVISIGNMTVQKNVNSFGEFAMSGMGAYQKLEGIVFLPINCLSMALPTYIGQNLGAGKYDRAKKGAAFGIFAGMILAELVGVILFFSGPALLGIFEDNAEAVRYGTIHAQTVSFFFFLLAFSHCAAGVLRGCGKSGVPMATMLASWCVIRVIYVTVALRFFPEFRTISWAYPITWAISSVVFVFYLLFTDWTHAFEKSGR